MATTVTLVSYGPPAGGIAATSAGTVTVDDANNNTITTLLTLTHTTSGTPGAGIGTALAMKAESALGAVVASIWRSTLTTTTSGAEVGKVELSVMGTPAGTVPVAGSGQFSVSGAGFFTLGANSCYSDALGSLVIGGTSGVSGVQIKATTASDTIVQSASTSSSGSASMYMSAGSDFVFATFGSAVAGTRLGVNKASNCFSYVDGAIMTIGTVTATAFNISTNSAMRIQVDGNGNVAIGNAALTTTATDGFLYIPTCAGPPTGVPTAVTGRVPLVYDTTNNKFYIYNAAWKGSTVPGAWL